MLRLFLTLWKRKSRCDWRHLRTWNFKLRRGFLRRVAFFLHNFFQPHSTDIQRKKAMAMAREVHANEMDEGLTSLDSQRILSILNEVERKIHVLNLLPLVVEKKVHSIFAIDTVSLITVSIHVCLKLMRMHVHVCHWSLGVQAVGIQVDCHDWCSRERGPHSIWPEIFMNGEILIKRMVTGFKQQAKENH